MPQYCELVVDVCCPHCGTVITDFVHFQWGRVPCGYHLGDKVKWLRTRKGVLVKPFALDRKVNSWNCGDPSFKNVVALDCDLFSHESQLRCVGCSDVIEAIAVSVEDEVMQSVRALKADEFHAMVGYHAPFPDLIVVREDGSYWPRRDWIDHPLELID